MGTKILERNMLPSARSIVFEAMASDDAYGVINAHLLAHLSTSGAGDFMDVSQISYFVHEVMQAALFVNAQEYDVEAAEAAYLAAAGGA